MTAGDLIKNAMLEIGAIAPDESVGTSEMTVGLDWLNRILDNWNAERQAVYNTTFNTFTLVADLENHTIGPSSSMPTFTVTGNRPVSIDGANLWLPGGASGPYRSPITLRDDAWWLSQPAPHVESTIPTDLYYSPDWPKGTLKFWPVPSFAYQVELEFRQVLSEVSSSATVITLPPGYRDALTLTLAEDLLPVYPHAVPGSLSVKAQQARNRVFANNTPAVRLVTKDPGMPPSKGGGYFNWLSREIV